MQPKSGVFIDKIKIKFEFSYEKSNNEKITIYKTQMHTEMHTHTVYNISSDKKNNNTQNKTQKSTLDFQFNVKPTALRVLHVQR